MKKIILTQGKFAKVDDSDYEKLNKLKWFAHFKDKWYAVRNIKHQSGKKTQVKMHRVILDVPYGLQADHIDGDGLNNQRKNLRICDASQNAMNRGKKSTNTSGFKGVCWHKHNSKWTAQIGFLKETVYLGSFDTKEEAYEAYCKACIKYHGKFSNIK